MVSQLGLILEEIAILIVFFRHKLPMRFAILVGLILLIPPAGIAQTCKTLDSCEEAVNSYKSGNLKLDRDKDGVPCESLCGKNGERM